MKKVILLLIFTAFTLLLQAQNYNEILKGVSLNRELIAEFGSSISMSGNYAVVGALKENKDELGLNSKLDAGAAYIYERDSTGNWIISQKIVPSDRASYDNFGKSVSISGDYIVVGSNLEDHDTSGLNSMSSAGSAYVFERDSSGNWSEVQKLVASDRAVGDYFGFSVSISGNHIVVGANYEDEDVADTNTLNNAGSAYIFEMNTSGTWTQTQKIVASDRAATNYFGRSVSIDGSYIIIGAHRNNKDALGGNLIGSAGAAYIFEMDSLGTWSEAQKLVASDRAYADHFGYDVSLSGNYAVIGAYLEDHADTLGGGFKSSAGSAYIFHRDSIGNWTQAQKIVAGDRESGDQFGTTVSISGDYLVVGAPLEDQNSNGLDTLDNSGSAYIFKIDGTGNWNQLQKITSSDREDFDRFGSCVAISESFVLVGAPKEDEDAMGANSLGNAGSVYFYSPPRAIIKFTNSVGEPLQGGVAEVKIAGVWTVIDTTNAFGVAENVFDATGNYTFRMNWKGAKNQKTVFVTAGLPPVVEFQTVLVTAELNNSNGDNLMAHFDVYTSYWQTFGSGLDDTLATMELLPTYTTVKIFYDGTTQVKNRKTQFDSNFVFVTVPVTVELNSSTGSDLLASFEYYSASWKTLGSGNDTNIVMKELLSKKYNFRVSYGGAVQQISQKVNLDSSVVFTTALVTAELNSSVGSDLAANFEYYTSSLGWSTFGLGVDTSLATMELLRVYYNFRVNYENNRITKAQQIYNDSNVVFSTTNVTLKLVNNGGTDLAGSGFYKDKDGVWIVFGSGTTPSTMEMLPKSYPFKVVYSSTNYQTSQNVGMNPVVTLSTGSAKTGSMNVADASVTMGVYPNPFAEFTNFTFDLDETTDVSLIIYDLSGKLIRTLADREFESGTNQVRWDGNNNFGNPVANGVYFYRIEAGEFVKTNRIIVTR